MVRSETQFVVDGLTTRIIEAGSGPALVLLHGGSLGCSADDWRDAVPAFAERGFRAITFDQPGYGASDAPSDASLRYRQRFTFQLLDSLGVARATIVGHSQTGRIALAAAIELPARVASAIVLCTGSILPPLSAAGPDRGAEVHEPTRADVVAQLEAAVYDKSLVNDVLVDRFYAFSTGRNLKAATERSAIPVPQSPALPDWQRLAEPTRPLMLVYGENDRGPVAERIALARERYRKLPIHLLEHCGHFAQWDQPAAVVRLVADFAAAS